MGLGVSWGGQSAALEHNSHRVKQAVNTDAAQITKQMQADSISNLQFSFNNKYNKALGRK